MLYEEDEGAEDENNGDVKKVRYHFWSVLPVETDAAIITHTNPNRFSQRCLHPNAHRTKPQGAWTDEVSCFW